MKYYTFIFGFSLLTVFNMALGKSAENKKESEIQEEAKKDKEKVDLSNLLDTVRYLDLTNTAVRANHSHIQQLARLEAEADIEEANKRHAEALKGAIKARSIFDSDKSRYNLGYIGRGYDYLRGHPNSPKGIVDPGFRLPVVDLAYTWNHTADGQYRIPDNVDVISEPSAQFTSSCSLQTSERKLKASLQEACSTGVKASLKYGQLFEGSASFSLNADYKREIEHFQKEEKAYLEIQGKAVVYRARLTKPLYSVLSPEFEDALHRVSPGSCEGPENSHRIKYYTPIIELFGTHFTTEVTMGAKSTQRRILSKSKASVLDNMSKSMKISYEAAMKYNGFEAEAKGSHEAKYAKKLKNMINKETTEVKEFYIGGQAPEKNFEETGSTESLKNWARSAQENPAPIQYHIESIAELIKTDKVFRKPIKDVIERRTCLSLAIDQYCKDNVPDPRMCQTHRARHAEHHRSKRNTKKQGKPIKYGDFIQFSWAASNKNLRIGDELYLASGYKIKISDDNSNHADMFQILPPIGQESSLAEKNLTFGARFRLMSIKGDDMYIRQEFNKMTVMNEMKESAKITGKGVDKKRVLAVMTPWINNTYLIHLDILQLGDIDKSAGFMKIIGSKTTAEIHSWKDTFNYAGTRIQRGKYVCKINWPDLGEILEVHLLSGKRWNHSNEEYFPNAKVTIIDMMYSSRYTSKFYSDSIHHMTKNNDGTYNVFEDIHAYPAEFAFINLHHDEENDIVQSRSEGIIQVLSDSPVVSTYWGIPASTALVVKDDNVQAMELELKANPKNCSKIVEMKTGDVWNSRSGKKYYIKDIITDFSNTNTNIDSVTLEYQDERSGKNWHGFVLLKDQERQHFHLADQIKQLRIRNETSSVNLTITMCEVEENEETDSTTLYHAMVWKIKASDKEIRTSPNLHVVRNNHKKEETIPEKPKERERINHSIKFPGTTWNCDLRHDDRWISAFNQYLDLSNLIIRFSNINQTMDKDGKVILLSYKVSSYESESKLEEAMEKLETIGSYRDMLPCTQYKEPVYSFRKTSRWCYPSTWTIILLVLCATVSVALIIIMVKHHRYKRRMQNRFSDRVSDHYYGETVSPHDYVNAYVGLHHMMSKLARLSGHYDSPYFGMYGPRSDENHDHPHHHHHRNRRPMSAPCGMEPEDYFYFKGGCTRMNSRCHEKYPCHAQPGDGSASTSKATSEQDAQSHVRLRHLSKRSNKQKMRENIRRLTRCLSGDHEETAKNVKLNNLDETTKAPEGGLPKQHNTKVDKETRSHFAKQKPELNEALQKKSTRSLPRETTSTESTGFADSVLRVIQAESEITNRGSNISDPSRNDNDIMYEQTESAQTMSGYPASSKEPAAKKTDSKLPPKPFKRQETLLSQPYDHMTFAKQIAAKKPALDQIDESPSPPGVFQKARSMTPMIKPPFVLRRAPPIPDASMSSPLPLLVSVENEEIVNRVLPTESSDCGSRSSNDTNCSEDVKESPML